MQPAVCRFYILHLVFCILRFIPLEPIDPPIEQRVGTEKQGQSP
jgi:hypothetical protein